MSDVFISYSSSDRAKAKAIAEALERYGWSIWWDRNIPAGRKFNEVIETELGLAKAVIVLWSETSVKSDWVMEEASEGLRRGILFPILVGNVIPPFGFRLIQAASLIEWQGDLLDGIFVKLIEDMSTLLGVPPANPLSKDNIKPQEQIQKSSAHLSAEETPSEVASPAQNPQSIVEPALAKRTMTKRGIRRKGDSIVTIGTAGKRSTSQKDKKTKVGADVRTHCLKLYLA